MRIAHLGDLGHTLDPETAAKLKPLDVLMIPVGGYYTICPQQAKEIAIALDAKTIIPMHYRGAGTGLENVAYVDDFLARWNDDEVVYLPGCEYEVKPSAKRQIVVFEPDKSCPSYGLSPRGGARKLPCSSPQTQASAPLRREAP